jgi:hypothetical protein
MKSRLLPVTLIVCFAAALMPSAAHESEAFFIAFVIMALALSFTILKTEMPQNVAPVSGAFFVPVFGFWGVTLVSVLTSQISYTSFIYFCFFSLFPMSVFCSILAPRKDEFFAAIAWGFVAIFAAVSLFSLLQYFALPAWLVFNRTHWPFADPNALASFLIPAFFGGAGVMMAGEKSLQRNTGLALAILSFGAILTTGSRGGLAALAICFVIFLILSRPQLQVHKKCVMGLGGGMVAMAVLVNFVVRGTANMGERMAQTASGQMPLLWDRPALWQSTWEIIKAHPWTGTGIGTFYLYYPEVRDGDTLSAGRMVHSDPLQFWAEMGIVAPVLFYAFIGLAVYLTAQALDKIPKEDAKRLRVIAPFCGLGALVLQAHVNFPFYVLPVLMAAGVMAGYWFVQVKGVIGEGFKFPAVKLPHPEILKILLIGPLLALAYGFAMLQASNILCERANARGQSGDLAGFVRDMNDADKIAHHKNAQAIVTGAQTLYTAIGDPISKYPEQNLVRAEKLLDEAAALNPKLVTVPYTRAQLAHTAAAMHMDGGGDEEALLKEALAMNPLYFPARTDLGNYYAARGDDLKAFITLQEGLRWQFAADVPTEYYEALAREAAKQGKIDVQARAVRAIIRQGKFVDFGGDVDREIERQQKEELGE